MVRLPIRTECTSGAGFVTSADLPLFVEGTYPIGDVNAEKAEQMSHVDNNWKMAKSASDCWLLEMAIFVVVSSSSSDVCPLFYVPLSYDFQEISLYALRTKKPVEM